MTTTTTNGEGDTRATMETIRRWLDASEATVGAALPGGVDAARFLGVMRTELLRNPDILACTPASIIEAVLHCARLGLMPGPSPMGRAYFVPFNKRAKDDKGRWYTAERTATFIVGYTGLLELALRSPAIRSIHARLVYRAELDLGRFRDIGGSEPRLEHEPMTFATAQERGPVIGAYACALLERGGAVWRICDGDDFARARDAGGKLWETHPDVARLKTAVRRLYPFLPVQELGPVIEADDAAPAQAIGSGLAVPTLTSQEVAPALPAPSEAMTVDDLLRQDGASAQREREPSGKADANRYAAAVAQQLTQETPSSVARQASARMTTGRDPEPARTPPPQQAKPEPAPEPARTLMWKHAAGTPVNVQAGGSTRMTKTSGPSFIDADGRERVPVEMPDGGSTAMALAFVKLANPTQAAKAEAEALDAKRKAEEEAKAAEEPPPLPPVRLLATAAEVELARTELSEPDERDGRLALWSRLTGEDPELTARRWYRRSWSTVEKGLAKLLDEYEPADAPEPPPAQAAPPSSYGPAPEPKEDRSWRLTLTNGSTTKLQTVSAPDPVGAKEAALAALDGGWRVSHVVEVQAEEPEPKGADLADDWLARNKPKAEAADPEPSWWAVKVATEGGEGPTIVRVQALTEGGACASALAKVSARVPGEVEVLDCEPMR